MKACEHVMNVDPKTGPQGLLPSTLHEGLDGSLGRGKEAASTSIPWMAKKWSSIMKGAGLLMLLLLAQTAAASPPAEPAEPPLPFQAGERLVFQARWEFIPAGEAVLEVLTSDSVGQTPALHFAATAWSYPVIDLFYKVRNRIDAYTDRSVSRTLLYREKSEGRRPKDVTVTFDWERRTAQYTNMDERRDPLPIQPGSLDPLSIFYAFRLEDLQVGAVLSGPVTDGKKCITGTATVIRREKLQCAMGEIDTFLVEPSLEHVGGVFEKAKDAKIQVWVSADRYRIPVRLKSKVIIGSFIAELIDVSGTDWPHRPKPHE